MAKATDRRGEAAESCDKTNILANSPALDGAIAGAGIAVVLDLNRGTSNDSQASGRAVPALLPEERLKDPQATQPGHVPDARGRDQARAGRPVLQAWRLVARGEWRVS